MEIFYVLKKYVQCRLLQNCRMRERVNASSTRARIYSRRFLKTLLQMEKFLKMSNSSLYALFPSILDKHTIKHTIFQCVCYDVFKFDIRKFDVWYFFHIFDRLYRVLVTASNLGMGDQGSIPGQVIQKTSKTVEGASLLARIAIRLMHRYSW